jgi:hypothetical protein
VIGDALGEHGGRRPATRWVSMVVGGALGE